MSKNSPCYFDGKCPNCAIAVLGSMAGINKTEKTYKDYLKDAGHKKTRATAWAFDDRHLGILNATANIKRKTPKPIPQINP